MTHGQSGGGSELAEALVKLRGAATAGGGGVEVELAGVVSRRFTPGPLPPGKHWCSLKILRLQPVEQFTIFPSRSNTPPPVSSNNLWWVDHTFTCINKDPFPRLFRMSKPPAPQP